MGVYLKPCHGCPIPKKKADPECLALRNEMKKRVSGIGLSSASFRCPVLADHLRPGTRITINTPVLVEGDYFDDGYIIKYVEVAATIIGHQGARFWCAVDRKEVVRAQEHDQSESKKDPDNLVFRRPMMTSRIVSFLDEPHRAMCEDGNPVAPNGKCESRSCFSCRDALALEAAE